MYLGAQAPRGSWGPGSRAPRGLGPLSPEILQGIQADIKHLLLFGYNAFFFFSSHSFLVISKKKYTMQGPFPGPPEARAPILRVQASARLWTHRLYRTFVVVFVVVVIVPSVGCFPIAPINSPINGNHLCNTKIRSLRARGDSAQEGGEIGEFRRAEPELRKAKEITRNESGFHGGGGGFVEASMVVTWWLYGGRELCAVGCFILVAATVKAEMQ